MKPHKSLLRHLLLARAEWFEDRVMEGAIQSGYGEVTVAMNRMFAHLGGRPIGLSELARQLGVSRQSVHRLANEAALLNLVEFVPSEEDGRVMLLRFTQRGWSMAETARQNFESIEQELAAQIGEQDLEELRRILSRPWSPTEKKNISGSSVSRISRS